MQVYTALKETESRATDLLPLWKIPALSFFIPRQRRALEAVDIIRATTEELIARCKCAPPPPARLCMFGASVALCVVVCIRHDQRRLRSTWWPQLHTRCFQGTRKGQPAQTTTAPGRCGGGHCSRCPCLVLLP